MMLMQITIPEPQILSSVNSKMYLCVVSTFQKTFKFYIRILKPHLILDVIVLYFPLYEVLFLFVLRRCGVLGEKFKYRKIRKKIYETNI